MRKSTNTLALLLVALLAAASLQGCGGATRTGYAPGSHFYNVSSTSCMVLKAQQSKTGTIAGQQGKCG